MSSLAADVRNLVSLATLSFGLLARGEPNKGASPSAFPLPIVPAINLSESSLTNGATLRAIFSPEPSRPFDEVFAGATPSTRSGVDNCARAYWTNAQPNIIFDPKLTHQERYDFVALLAVADSLLRTVDPQLRNPENIHEVARNAKFFPTSLFNSVGALPISIEVRADSGPPGAIPHSLSFHISNLDFRLIFDGTTGWNGSEVYSGLLCAYSYAAEYGQTLSGDKVRIARGGTGALVSSDLLDAAKRSKTNTLFQIDTEVRATWSFLTSTDGLRLSPHGVNYHGFVDATAIAGYSSTLGQAIAASSGPSAQTPPKSK